MSDKKIVSFLDSINRLMFGELIEKNEKELVIKNVVVVNIVPQVNPQTGQPTGQMALQLIPVFFKEFAAEKDIDVIFRYPLSNIVQIDDMVFDFKMHAQYQQLFIKQPQVTITPQQPPQQPPPNSPVIKLFDN